MKKYKVVTLCGSTKFKDEFERVQKELTLKGNIVISVGLFGHSGDDEVWEGMTEDTLTETKRMLDDMHKRKIDMADEIFVVNPGGYIGSSTWSEIRYAYMTGKRIDLLEPIHVEDIAGNVKVAIEKARELADQSIDALRHEGVYADMMLHPSFRYKDVDIFDPWINEEANQAAFSDHSNSEQAVDDPFSYYGKKNVANYIERLLALHER